MRLVTARGRKVLDWTLNTHCGCAECDAATFEMWERQRFGGVKVDPAAVLLSRRLYAGWNGPRGYVLQAVPR